MISIESRGLAPAFLLKNTVDKIALKDCNAYPLVPI